MSLSTARAVLGAVSTDDDELVASESGGDVAFADEACDAPSNLLEHVVAGAVAAKIVDRFEAVEIDEEKAGRWSTTFALIDGAGQFVEQEPAVAQTGELVFGGLHPQ